MALDPKTLKNWMSGARSDAEEEKDATGAGYTPDEEDEEEAEEEEDEEEVGGKNPIWGGRQEPERVTLADADELLAWLKENEPEIADALFDLAHGISNGDEALIDHAKAELKGATQYLNPEYEPMDDEQKDGVADKIGALMKAKGHPKKDSPKWKHAVAIGVAETRKPSLAKEGEEEEPEEEPEEETPEEGEED